MNQSIGAIVAPFIIGLSLIAIFLLKNPFICISLELLLFQAGVQNDFGFLSLYFSYMILYMPTLALVNSVAFRQMVDPSKEFPPIRVFGTVGWIIRAHDRFLGWESQKILENTFFSQQPHRLF